jgi:ATP-dependent DNA helicase RecG
MTEAELKQYLKTNFPKESQEVEWKDFANLKHNVSGRKSDDVISYIAAISNQEGGYLIIGLQDNTMDIKGIQDFYDYTLDNICGRVLGNIAGLHDLHIEELTTKDTHKTIWIFEIPKHRPRTHIIAHNTFYLRKGDRLIDKGDELEYKKQEILREELDIPKIDWSAQICEGATIQDLDVEAIRTLRERLVIAKNKDEYRNLAIKNLLNRVNLLTEGRINNTCLLFLGKPEVTDKFLFDKNKISWVYRDELNDIEERLDIDEVRKPFILLLPEIQRNIQRFNTYLKDLDLFREDIRQYDDKAVEEVLVNAIAHRDWEIPLWIEVVQTPSSLEIRNPGEFLADWDKVLQYNQKPPYKNSNLVAFLNHIKLMEREGDGLRKVYKIQVGKG